MIFQIDLIRKETPPLVMAHRGDQLEYPENTLPAFKYAADIADVVETDVRLTKDHQLVLFHDSVLDRTTNKKGRLIDYTLAELEDIDLGYLFTKDNGKTYPLRGKGLALITLEQAFTEFPSTIFNLDIKNTETIAPKLIADVIKRYSRESSVIVGSFHHPQIVSFRRMQPNVVTSASPNEVKKFLICAKLHLTKILSPKYQIFQVPLVHGNTKIITKQFVEKAHSKGIAVHVWTINDPNEMQFLINLKVDGIFTDFPKLLTDEIKAKQKAKS